jgi:glycosyltransferase involved in cell wall biosynthesis
VALVHDWLTGFRGGEKVLAELAKLYPEADLYTLVFVPGSTCEAIERLSIHTSPLSRIPGIRHHYRAWLPLFPLAIRSFRLEGYDLIVSVSHAVAKAVPHDPGALHVSYCLTPMRYVWDQSHHYLRSRALQIAAAPLVSALRRFDLRYSRPEQVDCFLAPSSAVAERIEEHYSRSSQRVFPPVATGAFAPDPRGPDDFYLAVAGFVPYKREDLLVDAFRGLDRRLRIAGDGPLRRRLEAKAPPNVEFLGRVSDTELASLYARCRALLYPQEEDFGIIAVEAQAAGRPVIAFGRGGVRDTVRPLGAAAAPATGVFFDEQSPGCFRAAIRHFEENAGSFDPNAIAAWAQRFGVASFRENFARAVESARTHATKPAR